MTANETTDDPTDGIELSTDDIEDLDALYDELRATPGLRVQEVKAPPEAGTQGAILDLLTVALSGGAVASLINLVTALAESRGPGFRLKIRRGRQRIELTADNIEDALPALRELLRDS